MSESYNLKRVNRVEVIDPKGRSYVFWQDGCKVRMQLQDDGRTLKVFIDNAPLRCPTCGLTAVPKVCEHAQCRGHEVWP